MKPRTMPGLSSLGQRGSVAARQRRRCSPPAEAVVEPQRDEVHVLSDPVERTGTDRIDDRERVVVVAHEQVVVFDTHRPVRREAILKTDTDRAAPTGRGRRSKAYAGRGAEDVKPVAGDGRAALHIKERGIPGVADLAGKQTEGADLRGFRDRRIEQADA